MKEVLKPDKTLSKLLPPAKPRPGITYVPSCYTLPFSHNGKEYIYHNLTKQCVEGRLPVSAAAGESYDDLITAQFLVPTDRDETAYYQSISAVMRAYHRKKGVRCFTILPTLGCNARCIYCYEEGREKVTMSPETVEQTIRFILDNHESSGTTLNWFGGEPLLCTEIISRICEEMRSAGVKYNSSMISNGSLITPEIIKQMKEGWHLNRIQISMDGAEQEYIGRKNYYSYTNHYQNVIRSVERLSAAGIKVNIRCNTDAANLHSLPRFLEDLKSGIRHKGNVSVYFAPLNDVRVSENDISIREEIESLHPLILSSGFRAASFMTFRASFRVTHCMADSGSVVIAPDGSLYPCEHCPESSRYGDIRNGTTDELARQEFCRVDRVRDKCRDCLFLPDCTAFASCPIQDRHCREIRMMAAINDLKRTLERKNKEVPSEAVC